MREQLGSVTIPPGVRIELSRHPNPEAGKLLERALENRWLWVVPLAGAVPANLPEPSLASPRRLAQAKHYDLINFTNRSGHRRADHPAATPPLKPNISPFRDRPFHS